MTSKQQINKYAAEATFVFVGKVVKLKAATLEGIQTDNTAVVEVEHVVTGPPIFLALRGQQITVRLDAISGVKVGGRMTFFTNGWIFGKSVAVIAVGVARETEKELMASMVQGAATGKKDDILKERLDSAALGVVGTVSKVEKSPSGTTHISEHDPNWHEATIQVDEVVKGKKGTKEVTVLFPNSDDIQWHRSAKFSEGQKGIWLLQKGKKQDTKGLAPKAVAALAAIPSDKEVLTTLHPADFQPLSELGRVRSLLGK
jgi:hypothetical protein